MARKQAYPGSVIIEEKSSVSAGEGFLLVVFGVSVMGVALAVAIAVVQLSAALSTAIVAVGLGLGGSLGARGVADIIRARGQARAAVIEARQQARIEAIRAEVGRERLALERERLHLTAHRRKRLGGGREEEEVLMQGRFTPTYRIVE